jgi:hypothetical protein
MPTNTCSILISTGSNKGKKCRDINKYCRHRKTKCSVCGEEFSHLSSYQRHQRTTHSPPGPARKKIAVKHKHRVKDADSEGAAHYREMKQELQQLREEYRKVSARVDKVEQEPKNITLLISDEKIFIGLVKKMGGEKSATKFLLDNMDHKDSINIVEKMYLEGVEKNRYPIACAEDYKFRYLNRSGDIVDDKGGIKIVSTLENEIHTALIEANTHLIHDCVLNDDNVTLYNVYDIGSLHEQLGNYRKMDSRQLREDLAKKVYNTSHPFFQ